MVDYFLSNNCQNLQYQTMVNFPWQTMLPFIWYVQYLYQNENDWSQQLMILHNEVHLPLLEFLDILSIGYHSLQARTSCQMCYSFDVISLVSQSFTTLTDSLMKLSFQTRNNDHKELVAKCEYVMVQWHLDQLGNNFC